jgi:hypothetical protein
MFGLTLVEKANPNRHGWVKLLKDESDLEDVRWYVKEPDMDDCVEFDGHEDKARKYYKELVEELQNEPNWAAQAEYDEQHGTDNGYSPWQFTREY